MRKSIGGNSWMALLLAVLSSGVATGAPDERPRVAAHNQLSATESTQQVKFERRGIQRGDRIDQQIDVRLDLESTTRNGDQVVGEHKTSLARLQQRAMVAEEVVEGKTMAARVKFHRAEHTLNDNAPQPAAVVGKIYRCRRNGETLEVTRDDGTIPSPEEHEQVAMSMASLGQSNPLADYLVGKVITVGEKLSLPAEVGNSILGGDGSHGTVSRFELKLRDVVERGGENIARFDAEVEAEAEEGVQMRMLVEGTIEVEVATCRTVSLELSGPIARMSSFGSYSHRETTSVRGKIAIAMRAGYADK
jgi:hypothetical protein